ncbi:hypothetical protein CC80DRAFT_491095 [Byssothecium circinans]|uniref:Uncharacterized protein n=1 Tax=Byssothecium circinans TaxID=147558 RepID=A0A6A5U1K2_9PLEO|nr:hypothetical protein CC80DRAFT_491095 [Byssothecium circinans]
MLQPNGKGLEVSFEQMLSLAGAEYPVMVDGGLVFVGYQTVIVPVQIHRDYVQFHIEVNQDDQINPFTLKYGQRAFCEDPALFKGKRCFLGCCETAHIMLGNPGTTINSKILGCNRETEDSSPERNCCRIPSYISFPAAGRT